MGLFEQERGTETMSSATYGGVTDDEMRRRHEAARQHALTGPTKNKPRRRHVPAPPPHALNAGDEMRRRHEAARAYALSGNSSKAALRNRRMRDDVGGGLEDEASPTSAPGNGGSNAPTVAALHHATAGDEEMQRRHAAARAHALGGEDPSLMRAAPSLPPPPPSLGAPAPVANPPSAMHHPSQHVYGQDHSLVTRQEAARAYALAGLPAVSHTVPPASAPTSVAAIKSEEEFMRRHEDAAAYSLGAPSVHHHNPLHGTASAAAIAASVAARKQTLKRPAPAPAPPQEHDFSHLQPTSIPNNEAKRARTSSSAPAGHPQSAAPVPTKSETDAQTPASGSDHEYSLLPPVAAPSPAATPAPASANSTTPAPAPAGEVYPSLNHASQPESASRPLDDYMSYYGSY